MSQSPNDKQELVADLQAIPAQAGSIEVVLIDSGFYSESAVRAVEQTAQGQVVSTIVYAAIGRKSHHRSVAQRGRFGEERRAERAGSKVLLKRNLQEGIQVATAPQRARPLPVRLTDTE